MATTPGCPSLVVSHTRHGLTIQTAPATIRTALSTSSTFTQRACRCPSDALCAYHLRGFLGRATVAGITVKAGEGNTLTVLGMPLRFLCDAEDTDGAWSLMEEEIPVG